MADGRRLDFSVYERLLDAIGKKTSAIEAAHPEQFACKAGCHHCCLAIPTLLPVEWAYLSGADRHPDQGRPSQIHPGEAMCQRLERDGTCAVYAHRPVVCRTHGHLLVTEDGLIDHCPWNFGTLEEIDEDEAFRLEDLHGTLLQVNLDFLKRGWPDRFAEMARLRVRFHA